MKGNRLCSSVSRDSSVYSMSRAGNTTNALPVGAEAVWAEAGEGQ